MATVSALVHRHHRKSDGSYHVKIRVFHHQKKYIETEYYVTDNHRDYPRQAIPPGLTPAFALSEY